MRARVGPGVGPRVRPRVRPRVKPRARVGGICTGMRRSSFALTHLLTPYSLAHSLTYLPGRGEAEATLLGEDTQS